MKLFFTKSVIIILVFFATINTFSQETRPILNRGIYDSYFDKGFNQAKKLFIVNKEFKPEIYDGYYNGPQHMSFSNKEYPLIPNTVVFNYYIKGKQKKLLKDTELLVKDISDKKLDSNYKLKKGFFADFPNELREIINTTAFSNFPDKKYPYYIFHHKEDTDLSRNRHPLVIVTFNHHHKKRYKCNIIFVSSLIELKELQNDLENSYTENPPNPYVKNKADITRFYDPKGEDILTLIDNKPTKLFLEYLINKNPTLNNKTFKLKNDEIKFNLSPHIYSITSFDFTDKKFKNHFPYNIDLSNGSDSIVSQLTKQNLVEDIGRGRRNIILTINDRGKKRYIQIIKFPNEPKNTFHTITISNINPWTRYSKKIKYLTADDYVNFKRKRNIKEIEALKKDGIYYPIDGSEPKTVGVPQMVFKIRRDKTVEVYKISVSLVENPRSSLRYWRTKILKSINGVPMVNMNHEKLKKACQGKVGERIEIINKDGLMYKPKRVYWVYGDYETIDFDIIFPHRDVLTVKGTLTVKGRAYKGEYKKGRNYPFGIGVWKGENTIFNGFWRTEPDGVFTVTATKNKNKYAYGKFKDGKPVGKWEIYDPEMKISSPFYITFNNLGKVISSPKIKVKENKVEILNEKRTVVFFNLHRQDIYSYYKLVYALGHLTGPCRCENQRTTSVLGYTEYYIKDGKKKASFELSTICVEFKEGHVKNITEKELNRVIDKKLYKLWLKQDNQKNYIYPRKFVGRKSSSFDKIYAPTVRKDCSKQKEVEVINYKNYDIWFKWK